MYEQSSRINCRVAECFIGHVEMVLDCTGLQGSKVWSAIIYKNLPLPIHACIQKSARVCTRSPYIRVYQLSFITRK